MGSGQRANDLVDETRPLLQGARLTAWELAETSVPCSFATTWRHKSCARRCRSCNRCRPNWANGDTANKIGTCGSDSEISRYTIYVAAQQHLRSESESGDLIPIEVRSDEEITNGLAVKLALVARTTAFDVTPANLIAGIVTEKGVISPVNNENILQCTVNLPCKYIRRSFLCFRKTPVNLYRANHPVSKNILSDVQPLLFTNISLIASARFTQLRRKLNLSSTPASSDF